MPEEPDASPEDIEILDRIWRKRIEAKKQEREEKQISAMAERILQALQSRPDGMRWAEIQGLFDNNHSDEQIRQALAALMRTPLARNKVEKTGGQFGERLLAGCELVSDR